MSSKESNTEQIMRPPTSSEFILGHYCSEPKCNSILKWSTLTGRIYWVKDKLGTPLWLKSLNNSLQTFKLAAVTNLTNDKCFWTCQMNTSIWLHRSDCKTKQSILHHFREVIALEGFTLGEPTHSQPGTHSSHVGYSLLNQQEELGN